MERTTSNDSSTGELGPVRPGEQLDWVALAAYLRPRLGVDGAMEVLQFPNGSANLTYRVSFGDRHFVVRRPPFGQIAPGAHDMKREHRVLSKLGTVFPRAPMSYDFCDDHSVVGSDFVVLEYRTGEIVWNELPPSMRGDPDAGKKLGFAVVDALAELHLVDPASCGLEALGRPDGYVRRQVDGWRARWDLVATPDVDELMGAVAAELSDTLPSPTRATLLHNDFKIDNCQVAPGHPEAVTTILDWDMATLGDPLVDFGTLLNYWTDPADDEPPLVAGVDTFGLPTRAAITERYAVRTGVDVSRAAWYEAFATWKTAVVLQQLHQRYVRGESTDERMADRGAHVPRLAARAQRLLKEGHVDDGTARTRS
jgi:aminoglycoside phosphotransferase (APT) family kinase protein